MSVTPRHARRVGATLVALALATAATACTAGGAGGGSAKTLTIDTSFVIKSLDPGHVYEATGNTTVHALYDTLLTFHGSDMTKPQPDLATKYTVSADAKTFTFTLRDDARFSDGTPVTADDVVFSLNRLRNLKASPAVTVGGLTASKTDAHTVVVRSATADPNVPIILTQPYTGIVNSKVVKQKGGTDGADAAKSDTAQKYLDGASAGSGPYVLKSFDASSQVVLTANPKYWGAKPTFSRVVLRNMDVQNQKLTMAKTTGAELALDLSGKMLEGLPSSLKQSSADDTFYFLTLNADPAVSKVAANPAFVKAVRASIDYPGVAALFGGGATPAAGVVPPAYPGALPKSEAQHQDIAAAKKLLADAGLKNPTVSLMYPSITYRGVDLGTIATKVQGDAKKAGIRLTLDPQPLTSFLDKQRGGKVAMRFSPQSLNYPVAASLVNNLAPGQGTAATTGWTVARADKRVVAAGKKVQDTLDPAAQQAALQDWQRLLNQYSPYIPLAYNSGVVVAGATLTGAEYAPAGWQVDIAAVGRK
ncbi:ABC transporter substrate-binding protein [Actinocatenispora rupis]|uniref:ABC transporter substrate-binding protein n=1 Tax=Actinocatenispora rupis TaxID=519421 RepID=A0A8J3JGM2_9ACTN|nr:ABC transporter substrate-binding protein [Actinocatenispora rupis]GID15553.1 ABC transporter substrate-binding protein [Actinocatenispora rupis]